MFLTGIETFKVIRRTFCSLLPSDCSLGVQDKSEPLETMHFICAEPIQMCNSFFLRYTTPWIYIYIYKIIQYILIYIYILYIYVYGFLVPGSVHSPFINTWGFFVRDWAWRHVDRWMLLGRMAGAARVRRSWVFSVVIKGGWKMP